MVDEGNPVPVKFTCKEVNSFENSSAVYISSRNFGTVIDSEKRFSQHNKKSTMRFPTSHQPRSWGSDTQICRSSQKFRQKALTVCYKFSLSKNFQRQSCSAINYQSNGINNLAGNDPVPVKFAPISTNLY